ncbi:hypothetical protein KPL40_18050 [Clostridium gasigenes]|uniref:hypothetical protein n=1 Tax=Clostridium gasigenes TaxID=94869 RepID=UPI001C0CD711|nr:hypothetical protein [Clostridium gasigenes]MBU3134325.1 hypothetical protein [Clostridium gasigenes]
MKKFKLLVLSAVLGLFLMNSVPTFAAVLFSQNIGGTNTQSSTSTLGSGGRYITASGTNGTATATARKIIKFFPDSNEASIVVTGGQWSQAYFTSQAYNSDGISQGYYIQWTSNSNQSTGTVRFEG